MRSYCRLGSNPFATLSTLHYQLSTINYYGVLQLLIGELHLAVLFVDL
ncbi:MAG: hypothetical protein LBE12_09565 [Planctomycetaceae bacterium]|nr:hypothetical protein [Planctomycetaceae bacterium]